MKPFVVNRHGRLVFPANVLGELDFSVLDTLEHLTAVIERDFEAKAPTGTDILDRVESGAYPGRFALLRDLGQNLFWVNRYAMTMYEKRPTRWRDLAKHRDDVFLPVLTPWEDGARKVAAVERAYHELPATWDADAEGRVFDLLFDVFGHKLPPRDRAAGDQADGRRVPRRPGGADLRHAPTTTPTTRRSPTARDPRRRRGRSPSSRPCCGGRWCCTTSTPGTAPAPSSAAPARSATTTSWSRSTPAAAR